MKRKKSATRNEYASVKRLKRKVVVKLALLILVPVGVLILYSVADITYQIFHPGEKAFVQSVLNEHR